jgi:hypothetical protein
MTTHKPPPIDPETGRYEVSPTQEWRTCPGCSHLAWRTGPNEWECGCPLHNGCHLPVNQYDELGTPQLVWPPYRFRDVAYMPDPDEERSPL